MFEYFGGCPANLGFDNLKAATTKWHDGEPILNRTFADFMLHYDVAGIACRPGHPQDKLVLRHCDSAAACGIGKRPGAFDKVAAQRFPDARSLPLDLKRREVLDVPTSLLRMALSSTPELRLTCMRMQVRERQLNII